MNNKKTVTSLLNSKPLLKENIVKNIKINNINIIEKFPHI
jgi:hypothetical protein